MIQTMKKKFFVLLAILVLGLQPVFSQIIYTEEDEGFHPRQTSQTNELGVMVPMQNVDLDQWKIAPLGSGIMLLAGLGGAYLLAKRRKE